MRWGGPASPDQMAGRACIFLSGVGTSAVLYSGGGRQASAGGGQKMEFCVSARWAGDEKGKDCAIFHIRINCKKRSNLIQ